MPLRARKETRTNMKKTATVIVILALLLIVAAGSFYTVEENQYACVFRFSEIINTENTSYIFTLFIENSLTFAKMFINSTA